MKSEWQYLSLRDCITHKKGFAFKSSDYTDIGTPIVKVTNTTDNSIDMTSVVYISDELAEKNKSVELLKNDIVIATVGSWPTNPASVVGKTIKVPTDAEGALLNQNAVRIRPLTDSIDKLFLYYLLKNKSFSDYLVGNAQGSANQASITLEDIYSYETNIPPLPTQKKIAHILSTLDDKIELNRKMNQTLESVASAIFKSWFVDFDPVHAKANCEDEAELENIAKELGISKAILDLFPSEFIESELGMIPKGWENDYLDTFVEILDSKRIPLSSNEREKIKGDIPYYGATSIMGYVNDYIFNETLLLMGEDGSVVRDDGTPFLQYIWGKSWVNNHAHVMKSKSNLSVESLYIALINKNVTMFVTGAVQPKINQGNLKQIPIINAGEVINTTFSNLIEPIFAKIRLISEENTFLQKTRDTLLPKLLNGEIDVSELKIK